MIKKIRYRLVWNRSGSLNQRGEGLVQIEAEQQGRKAYFSTHTYLKPEQFARGCVVNTELADALNFTLFSMIRDVEAVELDYIKKGVEVTLPMLKEAVRAQLSPSAKLTDFGLEVINASERNEVTKKNYRTLFNNLERFRSGIRVADIDYQYVVSYDKWLRSLSIAHNTRISRLRLLRAVLNEAKKRDIISSNPFDRFRIQQMVSKKGYLSNEQLHRLEGLKLTGYDDVVRDAFLVGCYSGLRYSDIATLRQENIKDGWLVKTMVKTKSVVEVPVGTLFDGKMTAIIAKYGGDIGRLTKQLGSNAKVNVALHKLLEPLGVDAKITFHGSRHTFATLLGQHGVDIAVVSKLLGHSKLQTTEIYREVDRTGILNGLAGFKR